MIRKRRPRARRFQLVGQAGERSSVIPLTTDQYIRYLWWLLTQSVCPDCGNYHPSLN